MIVKPLTTEVELSASADTVGAASCVRLYNDSGADVLIVNATTSFSFTMPAGSITFCQKLPTDELTASANVKATSVAFSIS